jgi:hypothetical protein
MPVAADLDFSCVFFSAESGFLRVLYENQMLPDSPYLSSDRPPLI